MIEHTYSIKPSTMTKNRNHYQSDLLESSYFEKLHQASSNHIPQKKSQYNTVKPSTSYVNSTRLTPRDICGKPTYGVNSIGFSKNNNLGDYKKTNHRDTLLNSNNNKRNTRWSVSGSRVTNNYLTKSSIVENNQNVGYGTYKRAI